MVPNCLRLLSKCRLVRTTRGAQLARDGLPEPPSYFISRATEDSAVAREVADVIRSNGCGVQYQDEHIPVGSNFVQKMNEFLGRCRHLVILMSPHYVASDWCLQEWTSFYADKIGSDPQRHLAIIRVAECDSPPLLKPYVRARLYGVASEAERRSIIVDATQVKKLMEDALGGDAGGSVSPQTSRQMEEALRKLENLKVLRSKALIRDKIAEELERELAREFINL